MDARRKQMIGDEFKVWRKKPWYTRVRPYVYAAVLFGTFQAGQVYNATRIMDSVLPRDRSVVRDISRYEMEDPIALEQMK